MPNIRALGLTIAALSLAGCHTAANTVYFYENPASVIRRMPVDGGMATDVVSSVVVDGLAVDRGRGLLLGSTPRHVVRWTYTGGGGESVVPAQQPSKLAIDLLHGYIFFIERMSASARRCTLEGQQCVTVIEREPALSGMAVEPRRGHLFWWQDASAAKPAGIWRADLDGKNRRLILDEQMIVDAIAVDSARGLIFWSSRAFPGPHAVNRLMRANVDGSQPTVILTGVADYVEDIAVDPTSKRLFWVERGQSFNPPSRLRRVTYDGTGVVTLRQYSGTEFARAIALAHLRKTPR